MPIIPALPTFTANTLAVAEDITTALTNIRDTVNTYGVLTDVARTVTVTHTWTASQTFTGGWTAGAACTISTGGLTVGAGGITVTGNSTITGTLGGVTTATIGTGAFTTLSGNPNFSGTPTFGAGLTVTSGTGTIPTLVSTAATIATLYPQIVDVEVGGSGVQFRGTAALGSKSYLRWIDVEARVNVGLGAAATALGPTSIATNASIGFVHLPEMAGTPTGVVTATGGVPTVVDTTNNRVWYYHTSDWHYVELTATP